MAGRSLIKNVATLYPIIVTTVRPGTRTSFRASSRTDLHDSVEDGRPVVPMSMEADNLANSVSGGQTGVHSQTLKGGSTWAPKLPDVVTLCSDNLLSKWGFDDGDLLVDWLLAVVDEYEPKWGSPRAGLARKWLDGHKVLIRLIRERVLPALDQRVEIDEYGTIHNPVRARRVDGREVGEELYDPFQQTFRLTPEVVEVPTADVAERCSVHS